MSRIEQIIHSEHLRPDQTLEICYRYLKPFDSHDDEKEVVIVLNDEGLYSTVWNSLADVFNRGTSSRCVFHSEAELERYLSGEPLNE